MAKKTHDSSDALRRFREFLAASETNRLVDPREDRVHYSGNDGLEELADQENEKKIRTFNERLSLLTDKLEDVDTRLKAQDKKISSDKNRTIETLGVFVAIFTLVSTQVQIMQTQDDPKKILAFVLITAGLLAFFVLILDLMAKTRDEADGLMKIRFIGLLLVSILLVVAGIEMIAL